MFNDDSCYPAWKPSRDHVANVMDTAFTLWDVDRDGFLTKDEFNKGKTNYDKHPLNSSYPDFEKKALDFLGQNLDAIAKLSTDGTVNEGGVSRNDLGLLRRPPAMEDLKQQYVEKRFGTVGMTAGLFVTPDSVKNFYDQRYEAGIRPDVSRLLDSFAKTVDSVAMMPGSDACKQSERASRGSSEPFANRDLTPVYKDK